MSTSVSNAAVVKYILRRTRESRSVEGEQDGESEKEEKGERVEMDEER